MNEKLDSYVDSWKEENVMVDINMDSGKSYHGTIINYDDEIIVIMDGRFEDPITIVCYINKIETIVGYASSSGG